MDKDQEYLERIEEREALSLKQMDVALGHLDRLQQRIQAWCEERRRYPYKGVADPSVNVRKLRFSLPFTPYSLLVILRKRLPQALLERKNDSQPSHTVRQDGGPQAPV